MGQKKVFADDVETLKRKARMLRRGTELVDDSWDEIIKAMIKCAIKKQSVPAAIFLRDTFHGKPKERQELEVKNDESGSFNFTVIPCKR